MQQHLSERLYAPLFAQLAQCVAACSQPQGGVPAVAVDGTCTRSATPLPNHAGTGSARHEAFPSLLEAALTRRTEAPLPPSPPLVVTLSPAQCGSLSHGLAAINAQVIETGEARCAEARVALHHHSGAESDVELEAWSQKRWTMLQDLARAHDAGDLAMLASWYEGTFGSAADTPLAGTRPPIVLLLYGIERYSPASLNDILQSVADWTLGGSDCAMRDTLAAIRGLSEGALRIPLLLLLVSMSPTPRLPRSPDVPQAVAPLAPRVATRLAFTHASMPDKAAFWERVVCQFLLHTGTDVAFGRSVAQLLRRRFWHVEASWDSVAQLVRFAYVCHFAQRPLSALVHEAPGVDAVHKHWTPELLAHMRVALMSPYVQYGEQQQQPSLSSVPASLRDLVQDDTRLVRALPQFRAQGAAAIQRRTGVLALIDTLLRHADVPPTHAVSVNLGSFVASALELEAPYTDWNSGLESAQALTPATPSASQLRRFLQRTISGLAEDRLHAFLGEAHSAVAQMSETAGASLLVELASEVGELLGWAEGRAETSGGNKRRRGGSRQRPTSTPTAEPPSGADVRTRVSEWLTRLWTEAIENGPASLSAAIWTYDFAEPVSVALEGAGRAALLLALDAPTETIASMYAAAATCSGQRELDVHAGWPERVAQTSEVDVLRSMRSQLAHESVPDICRVFALYKDTGKFINLADWFDAFVQTVEGNSGKSRTPQRGRPKAAAADPALSSLQLRFSLAINELAHMGLLGPTGRKVEHLSRTVWDLPVERMPTGAERELPSDDEGGLSDGKVGSDA